MSAIKHLNNPADRKRIYPLAHTTGRRHKHTILLVYDYFRAAAENDKPGPSFDMMDALLHTDPDGFVRFANFIIPYLDDLERALWEGLREAANAIRPGDAKDTVKAIEKFMQENLP